VSTAGRRAAVGVLVTCHCENGPMHGQQTALGMLTVAAIGDVVVWRGGEQGSKLKRLSWDTLVSALPQRSLERWVWQQTYQLTIFSTYFTESQNHRTVGVGRDLCGSSSPTLLPKQGHLQQAAQDCVHAGLEYLQRRRLHNFPQQGSLFQCSVTLRGKKFFLSQPRDGRRCLASIREELALLHLLLRRAREDGDYSLVVCASFSSTAVIPCRSRYQTCDCSARR